MEGIPFPLLEILDLTDNEALTRIDSDIIGPYMRTLTDLRLTATRIRRPQQLGITASLASSTLTNLNLDRTDFQVTRQFMELMPDRVHVSLWDSRRSHRAIDRLAREVESDKSITDEEARTLTRRRMRVHTLNAPARPGSDDDIPSDGWSTEF